jgi:hypothetical protein
MELQLETRKRFYDCVRDDYSYGYSGGQIESVNNGRVLVQGMQETTSSGHNFRDLGSSKSDIGGYFYTQKDWYEPTSLKHGTVRSGDWNYLFGDNFWTGTFRPPGTIDFDSTRRAGDVSSLLTLNGMGATAISRVLPTNPASDAMVFLGETLKEGIPNMIGSQLLKSKGKDYREYGSEYLNYQFGIAPIVSDLKSFGQTAHNAAAIMRQYERDSGKNIRRRYAFPIDREVETTVREGTYPDLTTGAYFNSSGQLKTTTTYEREVWFSGCFTYYLNLGKSQADRMQYAAQQAKRLYGVRLTPDVLWNLAPWSWAADWVANTGDVLKNISAFSTDGLVMRYGYIMETRRVTVDRVLRGAVPKMGTDTSYLHDRYGTITKVRHAASPYGFGLSPDSFTGKQWSILAALGIARGPKQL